MPGQIIKLIFWKKIFKSLQLFQILISFYSLFHRTCIYSNIKLDVNFHVQFLECQELLLEVLQFCLPCIFHLNSPIQTPFWDHSSKNLEFAPGNLLFFLFLGVHVSLKLILNFFMFFHAIYIDAKIR